MSNKLVIIILNSLGAVSVALAMLCSVMLSDSYDHSLISYEETDAIDGSMLAKMPAAESTPLGPSPGTIFLSAPYAHFSK